MSADFNEIVAILEQHLAEQTRYVRFLKELLERIRQQQIEDEVVL